MSSTMPSPWEMLRRKVLRTNEIREIDRRAMEEFGMNSLVLMENAAVHCVSWIRQRYPDRPKTVVLCGSGNNGGDGIVITRHLRSHGWNCECFILASSIDKLSTDARANAQILLSRPSSGLRLVDPNSVTIALEPILTAELIIDAMLGTGASGPPRTDMELWIMASNKTAAAKIAIDIPTGVNADTGEAAARHFRADSTLTFVALKPAMVDPKSNGLFGEIEVLPIGIPEQLIQELLQQ